MLNNSGPTCRSLHQHLTFQDFILNTVQYIYNRRRQSQEVLKVFRCSDYLILVEYLAVVKVSVGEYPVDAAADRTQLSHRRLLYAHPGTMSHRHLNHFCYKSQTSKRDIWVKRRRIIRRVVNAHRLGKYLLLFRRQAAPSSVCLV